MTTPNEESDQIYDALFAQISESVKAEMRTQLMRNLGADKRRMLDMALRFELQKLEKKFGPLGGDVLNIVNAVAEEVGNEIRAAM